VAARFILLPSTHINVMCINGGREMRFSSARIAAFVALCGVAAFVSGTSASAAPVTSGAMRGNASSGPGAVAATSVNWAQDGFSKGNIDFNAYETAITTSTVASVNYRFSITSQVVRDSCIHQQPPVIDGGRLFVADQAGFGAYNATTGAPLWSVHLPDPDEQLPPLLAVSGTTVLAIATDCISQSDPDSQLTAYNTSTGAVLWSVFRDAPMWDIVIDGGIIAVAGADAGGGSASGYRLSDGVQVWNRDNVSASGGVSAGGRILLQNFDGTGSVAINDLTGAVLWSTPKTWSAVSSSTDGSRFVVNDSGNLTYVNSSTGAVVWTKTGLAGSVAVDAGHIYDAHGTSLTSLTLAGATTWNLNVGNTVSRPALAGGVLYAYAGRDTLVLNAATDADADVDPPYTNEIGHAVIVNGLLYVTNGRVLDAYAP
jgi:outer membrane protein assembly factor BamB